MKPTPLNKLFGLDWDPKDLQAKFHRCFVNGTILKDGKLVYQGTIYINDGAIGGDKAVVRIKLNEQDDYLDELVVRYQDLLIVDDRPNPVITNFKGTVFHFTWNPARQWQRGICNGNCYIYFPSSQKFQPPIFDFAEAIFNPSYSAGLKEALAEVGATNRMVDSRAFNKLYWIKKGENSIAFYRRKALLGNFIGSKFFPTAASEILTEELRTDLPELKGMYA